MSDIVIALAKVGYQTDDSDPESVVWFEAGEEVKDAPEEVVEQWRANGSVGDPPATLPSVVAEREQLQARVAQLEQQLADAKKAPAPASTAPKTTT